MPKKKDAAIIGVVLLVLMVQAGITVEEITRELEKRHVIDHKVKQERMQ